MAGRPERTPPGAALTTERLREFFAPQSIAIVGASDTSGWARFVALSSTAIGFTGPLLPVHPRHATALGRPAVPSLRDLAEPADLAFIMAPTDAVESGAAGRGRGRVRNVDRAGVRVPRGRPGRPGAGETAWWPAPVTRASPCSARTAWASSTRTRAPRRSRLTIPLPLTGRPGRHRAAERRAGQRRCSASSGPARSGSALLATIGNEAMISTADVLQYLAEDPDTKVICLFLEEIGDPVAFARAADRAAAQAGKPIVALKVGSGPAGEQSALAHTGAVAGDDAVVSALLADQQT